MHKSRRRRRVLAALVAVVVVLGVVFVGTSFFTASQISNNALSVEYQKANVSPYDFDQWMYGSDPKSDLDLDYSEVDYDTPLGTETAWAVPASDGSRWVILVHGKGGSRAEMLRNVPYFHDAGYGALLIDYRNDPGSPEDPSGSYQYGLTERDDIEGAVDYLVDQMQATEIVLFGNSAGGAHLLSYLKSGPVDASVTAAILDSPVIEFTRMLDWAMRGIPIPGPVVGFGKYLASRSSGVPFDVIDYSDAPETSAVPILIIHGVDDAVVPIDTSRELAEKYPSQVSLVEFGGADHCESLNRDPQRYTNAIDEFLITNAS